MKARECEGARLAFLFLLLGLVITGCGAKGGVATPRPFPGAPTPPVSAPTPPPVADAGGAPNAASQEAPATAESGNPLVTLALTLLGTPYRFGGSDPAGFDCSGFVQWVFSRLGIAVPREVREQFAIGRKIDDGEVRPGDLVFFETVANGASHVGIAIGNGHFVHAPSSRGVVRVERYTTGYWAQRWVGARRLLGITATN